MSKKRILVIDDDPRILSSIKEILTEEGFFVITAASSDEALYKTKRSTPDLIILDIMLPEMSGWDVCRVLKGDERTQSVPVLMISGTSVKSKDRETGLNLGADDYIIKPFHANELVARIRAILRRVKPESVRPSCLSAGDIRMDIERRAVTVKDKKIKLNKKEFSLLTVLMRERGRVLSKDFLLESIWERERCGKEQVVEITVQRLRKKIGGYGGKIETIHGLGYRLSDENR